MGFCLSLATASHHRTMRQKGGYWRRPVSRTYMYNLDVGEHYYSPMTKYLEAERGTRGETPGALTYDERLSKQWLYGRRYEATELRDRYTRASSLARGEAASSNSYLESEMAARSSARASSEIRSTTATASRQELMASMAASRKATSTQQTEVKSTQAQKMASASVQQKKVSMASEEVSKSSAASTRKAVMSESKTKITDDISKKVADIRMSPWNKGQELDEANAASARARARILELERELEEITRKAMTTQVRALKTAKQMAAEAMQQDEAAVKGSFTKTRKVMVESSAKIV